MNINGISKFRDRGDISVIDLLLAACAITIIIPLLTISLGANKTDLNRNLEGILIREIKIVENGVIPKVNVDRHRIRFGSDSLNANEETANKAQKSWIKKKSAFVWQRIAERIPGMISDEEIFPPVVSNLSPEAFTIEDLDQMAETSKINPMALALPAARRNFTQEESRDDIPVSLPLEIKVEDYAFYGVEDEDIPLESAKDFVDSLINETYGTKRVE